MGIKFTGDITTTNDPVIGDIGVRELFLQLKNEEIWTATTDNGAVPPVPTDIIMIAKGSSIDIGTILMYDGNPADLPAEWKVCDGNNGTPDLRNRFVVGGDATNTGNTGGSAAANMATHSHTIGHTHSVTLNSTGSHNHVLHYNTACYKWKNEAGSWWELSGGASARSGYLSTTGDHSHTYSLPSVSFNTSSAGTNSSTGNMPQYTKLIYIKKII